MILSDDILKQVKDQFAGLQDEVVLKVFTQSMECQYCKDNRQLVEEMATASDKIKVEIYDFEKDKKIAEEYKIDKIPAIAAVGKKDYGIRFYGIPAGYEFTSLIETIKLISTGQGMISQKAIDAVGKIDKDVHLQVCVTPTCPYCPSAVLLGFNLAYFSDHVRADMVEVSEFPTLSVKYQVEGVPKTVINEVHSLEGAAPEDMMLQKLQEILS